MPTFNDLFPEETPTVSTSIEEPSMLSKAWDWYTTRPGGERPSIGQQVTGPLATAFKAIPFSDELLAGGAAGLAGTYNYLSGGEDSPYSSAYDQALTNIRGDTNDFAKASPIVSTALQLGSAAKLPISFGLSAARGVVPAVGNIAKATAGSAGLGALYGAGEGEGLDDRLTKAWEGLKIGALLGGGFQGASEVVQGGARKLINALSTQPTEEQALLQVFKKTGKGASDLNDYYPEFKKKGLIADPSKTSKPFADTYKNLENERNKLFTEAGDIIADSKYKAKDVLDGLSVTESDIASGISADALTLASAREKDQVIKVALRKLYREGGSKGTTPEVAFENYKKLLKKDPKRAKKVLEKIGEVDIEGKNVWGRRQNLDNNAGSFEGDSTGKAEAYETLRDSLQQKILEKAGDKKEELGRLFNEGSKIIETLKENNPVSKLVEAEKRGETQQAPGLLRALSSGVKGAYQKVTGNISKTEPPVTKLRQAFGQTLPQKFTGATGYNPLESFFPVLGTTAGALAPGLPVKEDTPVSGGVSFNDLFPDETSNLNIQPTKANQETLARLSSSALSTQNKISPTNNSTPPPTISSTKSSSKSAFIDDAISRAEARLEGVTPSEPTKSSDPMDSLLDAVEMQESGGDVNAISSEGAEGAYQFLPSTGRQYAKKLGVRYNPKNKAQQREIARAYLSDLLEMFDGDVGLALTGYHSGENRVKRLLRETGGSTLEDIRPLLGEVGKKYATGVLKRIPQLKQMGV